MIRILTEKNKVIAESTLALLKNNGIEGYIKKPEYGGYSHSISNHSIYGYDIYINEEDMEQAKEIIEFLQTPADEDYETMEEDLEFEREVQEMKERRSRLGDWCGRIIVAIVVVFVIVSIIFDYWN